MAPASSGFGPVVSRFRTNSREVWLTIDDGPDPLTTPQVLDLLERHHTSATFFVIGENVRRYPELAREIARRGHTLANHTDTHPAKSFWHAGFSRVAREIDRCNDTLQSTGVPTARYFRPPVGIKNVFIHSPLAKRGMDYVAWSARGFDSILSETTATRRILKALRPGAIVLLHDGNSDLSRVRVVERVLKGMSDVGFKAVIPNREQFIW
jgi:peptidoglycan/xylan/chitin deacetylase (PgdA/CDA1 family)